MTTKCPTLKRTVWLRNRNNLHIHIQHLKRITIHEISSLLFLASASVVKRLAAAWGSLICFTKSTASWFFITYVNTIQQRKFSYYNLLAAYLEQSWMLLKHMHDNWIDPVQKQSVNQQQKLSSRICIESWFTRRWKDKIISKLRSRIRYPMSMPRWYMCARSLLEIFKSIITHLINYTYG